MKRLRVAGGDWDVCTYIDWVAVDTATAAAAAVGLIGLHTW